MIRKIKINSITPFLIEQQSSLNRRQAIKLINNQEFLKDFIQFLKNWIEKKPNFNKKV